MRGRHPAELEFARTPPCGIGICADATLWNWNLCGRHPAEFEFARMRNSLQLFLRDYRLNSHRVSLRNSLRNYLNNSLRVCFTNSLRNFLKDSLRNSLLSIHDWIYLRNVLRHYFISSKGLFNRFLKEFPQDSL